MKTIITTFFFMFFTIAFSQDEVGYFIKVKDSTKVIMYSKLCEYRQNIFSVKTTERLEYGSFVGNQLLYYDINEKNKYIPQRSIKELYIGKSTYIRLPMYSNGKAPRLHRIIAYSDDYLFTVYKFDYVIIYYVFNKKGEFKESIWCYYGREYDRESDVFKKFMTTFETYFSKCPQLKEIFNSEIPLNENSFIEYFKTTENLKLECN